MAETARTAAESAAKTATDAAGAAEKAAVESAAAERTASDQTDAARKIAAAAVTAENERKARVLVKRPLGIKGLFLNDISLKGVVVSKDPAMTLAIIQAPGNKIFTLGVRDELFDSAIKEIRKDGVVFRTRPPMTEKGEPLDIKEIRADAVVYTKLIAPGPRPVARDVVLKVHDTPGDKK
jgi:hypothetical protein